MKINHLVTRWRLVAALLLATQMASAGSVVILYENEAAVREGRATVGTLTEEGILTSAKIVLASPSTILAGCSGDALRRTSLVKLDANLDMAVLKLGEAVPDEALQKAFQEELNAVAAFLPSSSTNTVPSSVSTLGSVPAAPAPLYTIKINKKTAGSEPVPLKASMKKSRIDLEIIRVSTVPVWFVTVELTADPRISFWNEGRPKGLTDVPDPRFKYQRQIFMIPLAKGRSIEIPVGLYYISSETATLHLKITTKPDTFTMDIPVVFNK